MSPEKFTLSTKPVQSASAVTLNTGVIFNETNKKIASKKLDARLSLLSAEQAAVVKNVSRQQPANIAYNAVSVEELAEIVEPKAPRFCLGTKHDVIWDKRKIESHSLRNSSHLLCQKYVRGLQK